jgi:hypothetical protein
MTFMLTNSTQAAKWRNILSILTFLLMLIAFSRSAALYKVTAPAPMVDATRLVNFGSVPLHFEPNAGQADAQARFLAHGSGGILYFEQHKVTLLASSSETPPAKPISLASGSEPGDGSQESVMIRMSFVGASFTSTVAQGDLAGGKVNYLIGSEADKWHTNLPTYSSINYAGLYPGIDLRYEGEGKHLKGTYTVSPGADPTRMRWRYEMLVPTTADNAEYGMPNESCGVNLSVDDAGNLRVALDAAASCRGPNIPHSAFSITEQAPVAWQEIGGQQRPVKVSYVVHNDSTIGFEVGSYDPGYPLIIDPVVTYANYFGGTNNDFSHKVALDSAGNAYIVGWTTSADFPLVNPYQSTLQGFNDVFVAKLSADGSTLLYSTYLGGSQQERGFGIALDDAGNAYITGRTDSTDFPTRNAYQPASAGPSDAFVTKLNASGSDLIYSTYMGGAVLEGSDGDLAYAIAVDGSGNAYITGETGSPDFPVVNAIQPTYGGGNSDAFVTKLNAAGNALVYSTFLGGSGGPVNSDAGNGIAVDGSGNTYVTGSTSTGDFPTANAIQPAYGGGEGDAFVTKLNPSGSAFVYSTYLGGDDNFSDGGSDIVADEDGNAYITGLASSVDFPTHNPIQGTLRGITDVFITKLNPSGSAFIYSTLLGGNNGGSLDIGNGITIDAARNVYITGLTGSQDFPTVDPIPPGPSGYAGIFVAKLQSSGSALVYSSYVPRNGNNIPANSQDIEIDGQGGVYIVGYAEAPNSTEAFAIKISEGTPGTATATVIPTVTTAATPPTSTPLAPTSTSTHILPTNTPTVVMTTQASGTSTPVRPTNTAVATATSIATACALSFSDVPLDSTFYSNIRCLACRGIISGYDDGTFRPFNDITRAQIAKIVSNSAGFDEDPGPQIYEDVDSTNTFYPWINRLSTRGFMGGYPCGTVPEEPCNPPDGRPYFRPFANATRGQLAKIVSNAAGIGGDPTGLFYADVVEEHPFYVWVMRLTDLGVMSGYPCGGDGEPCDGANRPYFRPFANVTRGQASKIVANTFYPNCETPAQHN